MDSNSKWEVRIISGHRMATLYTGHSPARAIEARTQAVSTLVVSNATAQVQTINGNQVVNLQNVGDGQIDSVDITR